MKADGKAIVIITHKLHEVMALSDKVAVLRKGKYIGTVKTSETDPQALTDMMVGHSVTLNIDRPSTTLPSPPDPEGHHLLRRRGRKAVGQRLLHRFGR